MKSRVKLQCAGFTLVELLAVVAIIGLLLAMVAGGITAVRESARRQQARAEAMAIIHAIKAYRVEYGRFPAQNQGDVDMTYRSEDARPQGPIFLALWGTNAPESNPRQIVFLESRTPGPFTCPVSGCWLDPWRQHYIIALDEDGDGNVTIDCPGLSTTVVAETVAVASVNGRRAVYSWLQ